MRAPLSCLAIGAVLLAGACGGGPQTSAGQVSDVAGRLCLQTDRDNGSCFVASAGQLALVHVGDCVKVTFTPVAGSIPTAADVRVVAPPCFSGRH